MTTPRVDALEREIFIRAGIERVWSLISRTGFWVGDLPRFEHEAREGEQVVIETPNDGAFPARVERLEPPRYTAYRWASGFPGAEPAAGNSTLVEFTLVEREGGVLVSVRESGFATLATDAKRRAAARDDNARGWAAQLTQLLGAAEGAVVA